MTTMKMLFTCLGLMFLTGSSLLAQTVAPPPGFTPWQDDSSASSPVVPQRIYSGHSEAPSPGVISGPMEFPTRGSIVTDGPSAARIYGRRDPVVVFADDAPPLPRFWVRAEALVWWSKASPLPVPFVTVANDPTVMTPGALGQSGTSVLIGDQTLQLPGQGGGRFTFGFSLDPQQTWGAEASYFSLANALSITGVTSDGSPGSALLAFPFYNPTKPGEDASPISLPGNFAGRAIVSTQSMFQGADVNILNNRINSNGFRFDLLGGFRYANLQEGLKFTTDSPNVFPNPPGYFHTFDQFTTSNNFYGGQVGVRASYDTPFVFVNATTKLAMGGMYETVAVNGGTFTNTSGASSANGAYFSQPTNIGSMTRDQFAVMPELNLNLGFRLSSWANVTVGYSFLYLSSVARPGDQIDRVINPSQAPAITGTFPGAVTNPQRPELNIHNTDFWAQGLNFAFELRF